MRGEELVSLPVSELLTEAATFPPTTRVSELMGFMKDSKLYEGIIGEETKTSIVTIRDLLGITSLDTKVSALMHQVPRLNKNNSVGDAAALLFEYRVRAVPVYQGEKLMGVVTSPAIVKRLMDSPQTVKLSSLMTPQPITMESSSPVSTARELMIRKKIDQVPVVDGSKLRGVITSQDLVLNLMPGADVGRDAAPKRGRFNEPIGQFPLDEAPTSEITDPLGKLYQTISRTNSNYCLVVNTGELQGIVTYRDFMRIFLSKPSGPNLPMYIVGLPDDPFDAGVVRSKFLETIALLKKTFPDVGEARAVIKSKVTKAKTRSEVSVLILSPTRRYSYTVASYDLADAFDEVHRWAKKLVSEHKPNKRRKVEEPQFPD